MKLSLCKTGFQNRISKPDFPKPEFPKPEVGNSKTGNDADKT